MCEKYQIRKIGKMYRATNRVTSKQYSRPVFRPGEWQFLKRQIGSTRREPVEHTPLIDTLENAVVEYELEHETAPVNKPPRRTFRMPIRPANRQPLRRPQRGRGEGNRIT